MNSELKKTGFSLAEVLLAIGTLAVGVLFVAGVFPVGIHLTTVAIERTIAAIAADEAFAKIKLYNFVGGVDLGELKKDQLKDFNDVLETGVEIDPCEFTYPSTDAPVEQKHYYWTALCRDTNSPSGRLVQVTVFVCRKVSPNLKYWDRDTDDKLREVAYPVPVKVKVSQPGNSNELLIGDFNPPPDDQVDEKAFVNDGYTIVDDTTGRLYRVLERYASPRDNTILLDRNWEGDSEGNVWVVPPPVTGGRGPCIGVYQKVIRF